MEYRHVMVYTERLNIPDVHIIVICKDSYVTTPSAFDLVLTLTYVLWIAMFAQKIQPINTQEFYFLVKG